MWQKQEFSAASYCRSIGYCFAKLNCYFWESLKNLRRTAGQRAEQIHQPLTSLGDSRPSQLANLDQLSTLGG